MDVQNLIELFEIESGTLNSLVRQHGDLAPSFSRDFKGVDLNKLKLSYLQFLKMKADYVQFTCPAFRAAGEALSAGDEEDVRWSKVFLDYSTGETDEEEGYGHEVWARNDMSTGSTRDVSMGQRSFSYFSTKVARMSSLSPSSVPGSAFQSRSISATAAS